MSNEHPISHLLEAVKTSDPENNGRLTFGLAIQESNCSMELEEVLAPVGEYVTVEYDILTPAGQLVADLRKALETSQYVVLRLMATPTSKAMKQLLSLSRYHALDLSEISATSVSFFPLARDQRVIVSAERSVLNQISDPLFFQCFGPVASVQ